MSGFLLDTNCISEVVSPKPAVQVLEWIDSMDERLLFLSVITIGEIRKGVSALPQGVKRSRLESWIDADLPVRFAKRILPVDGGVADRWGRIMADAPAGKKPPVLDTLIAATALHHNLTVVTRNRNDFLTSKVPLLNPWEG